jgi:hypothetical protein
VDQIELNLADTAERPFEILFISLRSRVPSPAFWGKIFSDYNRLNRRASCFEITLRHVLMCMSLRLPYLYNQVLPVGALE